MSEGGEIFVRLLDEGVEVWRPVQARQIGPDRYLILEQRYDCEVERWEFGPGDDVVCAMVQADGGAIYAALKSSKGRSK
jgi:hypothetical protein